MNGPLPRPPAKVPVRPHEHEFEAAHGLPEALPKGESILWQGGPRTLAVARHVLHADGLAAYFALLFAWQFATGLHDHEAPAAIAAHAAPLALSVALLSFLIGSFAWMVARTTVYTITDRRVVMRIGVVLNVTLNLPFSAIASADLRRHGAGAGDIALTLAGNDRLAWLQLWPHVRPWQLRHPRPMLRALPDAPAVGRLLAQALQRAQGQPVRAPVIDDAAPRPAPSVPAALQPARSH